MKGSDSDIVEIIVINKTKTKKQIQKLLRYIVLEGNIGNTDDIDMEIDFASVERPTACNGVLTVPYRWLFSMQHAAADLTLMLMQ